MIRATIGTCNGCGLGLNLPNRPPWHPGTVVVVMTEEEANEALAALALVNEVRTHNHYIHPYKEPPR